MSVAGAHVEARIGDADVGPDGRVVDLEATLARTARSWRRWAASCRPCSLTCPADWHDGRLRQGAWLC